MIFPFKYDGEKKAKHDMKFCIQIGFLFLNLLEGFNVWNRFTDIFKVFLDEKKSLNLEFWD